MERLGVDDGSIMCGMVEILGGLVDRGESIMLVEGMEKEEEEEEHKSKSMVKFN